MPAAGAGSEWVKSGLSLTSAMAASASFATWGAVSAGNSPANSDETPPSDQLRWPIENLAGPHRPSVAANPAATKMPQPIRVVRFIVRLPWRASCSIAAAPIATTFGQRAGRYPSSARPFPVEANGGTRNRRGAPGPRRSKYRRGRPGKFSRRGKFCRSARVCRPTRNNLGNLGKMTSIQGPRIAGTAESPRQFSKNRSSGRYWISSVARASTATATACAPPRRSTRAATLAVAPVVSTSSTRSTRAPAKGARGRMPKAPRRFRRR